VPTSFNIKAGRSVHLDGISSGHTETFLTCFRRAPAKADRYFELGLIAYGKLMMCLDVRVPCLTWARTFVHLLKASDDLLAWRFQSRSDEADNWPSTVRVVAGGTRSNTRSVFDLALTYRLPGGMFTASRLGPITDSRMWSA